MTELKRPEPFFVKLMRKPRAHDEHAVMGPANPRRAPVRIVGRHESLHVRQGKSDVPSFGALPRQAWMALGIVELACAVGLIVPAAFHWQPSLTILAATILAVESLVFVGVHVKYREVTPMIMSGVLGLVMAFVAYGRMVLWPIV